MRPGQQNKRGRGRGNNGGGSGGSSNNSSNNNNNFNRKGSNPLTRTYDSSGPDVKIRGTAQHIAEKYSTLARDSHSSGDRVMAENYLQHAEHYYRIIAAAQAQMQERFQRDDRPEFNDRDGNERDMDDMDGGDMDDQPMSLEPAYRNPPQPQQQREQQEPRQQHEPRQQQEPRHQEPRQQQPRQQQHHQVAAPAPAPEVIDGTGPQPVIDGIPAEVAIGEETPSAPRQPRRRNPTNRPRRQPRLTAEGDDAGAEKGGEDSGPPALADVTSE
ncbi:DUF4167 domain-containing protein [Rhizobium tubonense]|uniref:DUF4167 domain-containing protein n=1 Tax=Rhizobium tubonense TaxID=484088 RepID=A0A2W4CDW3_9HYPH|nr:DUF4167 domain-containing protein [Rhizobium tubonense]PZM09438.1 hypothetical protein CPY51_24390 [Rhizobium tubonense]